MKIINKILEIVLFPLFLVSFLFSLLFWDLVIRFAPRKYLDKYVFYLNLSIKQSLKILGTKFKLIGNLPELKNKSCLIVCNHQSMFDMPLLYCVFNKLSPRYVAKKELSKSIPGISICLRKQQSALIDRKNPAQALDEISKLADRMQNEDHSVVIFPEGTRARNGELKKFKLNGLKQINKNYKDLTIIPVALDGTWKLNINKYGPIPTFQNIIMRIGSPCPIEEVEQNITSLLNEIKNYR